MPGILQNLIGAGSSTVKDAVEWTLLYIAMNERLEAKIIGEIGSVIGFDRKPTYADRAAMPYLQAVIQEGLRISSMLPLNLPHV